MKVVVLGSSGMLGHVVAASLKSNKDLVVITISRGKNFPDYKVDHLDQISAIIESIKPNFVINCIGLVKPFISDFKPSTVLDATFINSIFPLQLIGLCEKFGIKLIQIATDCVYRGLKGPYNENDVHDADDIYGKTKSLGEINSQLAMNIRCSIIGPNPFGGHSLLNWVATSKKNAVLNGYSNHFWNGVSTYTFADVTERVITQNIFMPGVSHLVPQNSVSKFELLKLIAKSTNRNDLIIQETAAETAIDRTLSTLYPENNIKLWGANGPESIPLISEMRLV